MKDKKKKTILITSIALIATVALISGSMAYLKKVVTGEKQYIITAKAIILKLDETSNDISIEDAIPKTDTDGKTTEPYTFSLENTTTDSSYNYTIYLVDNDIPSGSTRVSDNYIKYYLTNDSLASQMEPKLVSSLSSDANGRILERGTIAGGAKYNYTLRFWVDYEATGDQVSGKSLSYKIEVVANQKVEWVANFGTDTSNANIPNLTSGMIPVVYNEIDKTWVKADTTQQKYYNYDTQNWANAVTVVENGTQTRDYYKNAAAGTPIDINDINTMWVWIPRYEYQYTDLGNSYAGGTKELPGEIKINFIPASQISSSDSTRYKIPEGFKFGDENLSGFWMAKFETSTLETCTAQSFSVVTDCDLTTLTPQVKPNVTSWRGARLSTFFQASRLMQDANNASKYGFNTIGNGTMDVHMLKNTEWGIVVMLSQSKYGKYGNPAYSGANKEVYQNKSSSYVTGNSNGIPSSDTTNTQVTYNTPDTGYGASITGTIYGVYDMSGGASEYVMGNYNKTTMESGFTTYPEEKYYDLYATASASTSYKTGDATYEISGWYSDFASFVDSNYSWFIRGGNNTNAANGGVFNMGNDDGNSRTDISFRLAIKP